VGKKGRLESSCADVVVGAGETPNETKSDDKLTTLMAGYGSSSDEEGDGGTNSSLLKNRPSDSTTTAPLSSSSLNPTKDGSVVGSTAATDGLHHTGTTTNTTNQSQTGRQCRYFLRNGTCKNGDNCSYIHDITKHETFKVERGKKSLLQSQQDKARNGGTGGGINMNRAKRLLDQRVNWLLAPTATGGGGTSGKHTLLRKLLGNDLKRERSLALQLLRYVVDCNYLQSQKKGPEVAVAADDDPKTTVPGGSGVLDEDETVS